jgi:predicted ribosomally synthesized peptide with nif11-like leader
MSIDAARNFIRRIITDNVLQERIREYGEMHVTTFLKLAREHGYEFSAEEYIQAYLDFESVTRPGTEQELDESELDVVAGGRQIISQFYTPAPPAPPIPVPYPNYR